MLLLLGDPADPLIGALRHCLPATSTPVRLIDEPTLFDATPFGLDLRGEARSGFLRLDGAELPLDALSAVVLRPPRRWWPPEDFSLKDQLFVYHETTAAWLTLLTGLTCPVVNRFELGWWLQDPNYLPHLRADLAARLGLPESRNTSLPTAARPFPTTAPEGAIAPSVYLAGPHLLPRTPDAEPIAALLNQNTNTLAAWQAEHGLSLCRLDFQANSTTALAQVDVFPLLDREPPDLVARIAAGIAEVVA